MADNADPLSRQMPAWAALDSLDRKQLWGSFREILREIGGVAERHLHADAHVAIGYR